MNLDHVATASPIRRAKGHQHLWTLCGADGHSLGVLAVIDGDDIERLFATYIPAAPGATAYEINVWSATDGPRPTAEDVHVTAHAVIAWQLNNRPTNRTVDPVVIEACAAGSGFWHLMPDGSVCSPGYMTVASLDAAKAESLTEAQKNWDRQHTAKVASIVAKVARNNVAWSAGLALAGQVLSPALTSAPHPVRRRVAPRVAMRVARRIALPAKMAELRRFLPDVVLYYRMRYMRYMRCFGPGQTGRRSFSSRLLGKTMFACA